MAAPKRLNLFERYLTVWVGLCMVAGLLLGKIASRDSEPTSQYGVR